MSDAVNDERKPFWGECRACNHQWPVCYVPMEVTKAAQLMAAAQCPKCGERKGITIAKQRDGVLLEPKGAAA